MHVHFYATLRDIVGKPDLEIEAGPGATVRQVFNQLADTYPALRERLFGEDGELSPHVFVHLSGRDILLESGLDTPLSPHDNLRLFMQLSGG